MKYVMKLIPLHKRNVINNTQTLFPLFYLLAFPSEITIPVFTKYFYHTYMLL